MAVARPVALRDTVAHASSPDVMEANISFKGLRARTSRLDAFHAISTAPLLASSIRLDLPKTEGAKPGDPPTFVTVAVDKSGQAFFNDKPVSQPELSVALQQAKLDNPDTEVQLRADQGVPYGRVVEVMGEAQKAGLNRIGFVAEAPAAAQPPGTTPAPAAGTTR